MKKSNFSSRNSFQCAVLTSDVHFKADVVKKEDELSFSVDIEEKITIACKFHFLLRLKSVRNELKLSLHSPMVSLKK